MGIWGCEVKPGKVHPYHSDNVKGKLYITQATLGLGSSKERSILQCSMEHKSPIFLCSLLPNKSESCALNLEIEDDELVAFSVIGQRSIHLSGYFVADDGDYLRDEYDSDSYGEDIAETETEESSEFDTEDEYEDDFIDDSDLDTFQPSSVPKSGVVIEEITEDEEPTNGVIPSELQKKKNKSSYMEDKNNSQGQIIVRSDAGLPILESEDEDGFPISSQHNSKATSQEPQEEADEQTTEGAKNESKADGDCAAGKKRKTKGADQDGQPERKKKKKKKHKEKGKEGGNNEDVTTNMSNELSETENPTEAKILDLNQAAVAEDEEDQKPNEDYVPSSEKKKKKKKKKTLEDQGGSNLGQTVTPKSSENKSSSNPEEQTTNKSSQVRTFASGLVVEALAMGKPDGKRASPGKQISVHYTGKLKKNGKIFDSNVGRAPFKFRLGVGQVIKGWDIGINGMRIGDKRRLTIPPSMGYGSPGFGGKIPPNSWLEFEVELVDVR